MGDLNSSTLIQPWNISIYNYNGTDHLWSKFAPAWVGTPNVRGTFDILESCIFTLIACVFTALHLDVLPDPKWQRLLFEKAKWVLLTIVIPEVSILTATNQLFGAWILKSQLKKVQRQQMSSKSNPEADFEINMKYAYFIIMGGLRFDVNDILSIPDIDPSAKRLFSNPKNGRKTVRAGPPAVLSLAKKGHWFKIQENQIDDKSKASIFQKALVLIQVLWMIMQCAWRLAFGFPLTLLEVHTILHVAFAVIQYCFWIKKPLDVQEAIVVHPHGFEAELAIMLQKQFYSRMSYRLALFPSQQTPEQPAPLGPFENQMRWIDQAAPAEMKVGDILTSGLALYRSDAYGCYSIENIWGSTTVMKHKVTSKKPSEDFAFELSPEFLRRWDAILSKFPDERRENLAETARSYHVWRSDVEAGIPDLPEREKHILLLLRLDEFRPQLLLDRDRPFWEGRSIFSLDFVPNFETQGFRETLGHMWKFWRYGIASLSAAFYSLCYAGFHFLPTILFEFPSYTEELLWKLSCLFIAGALPLYFAISGLVWLSIWLLFLNESDVLVFPKRTPESLKSITGEPHGSQVCLPPLAFLSLSLEQTTTKDQKEMALDATDPFTRLPPELRVQVLVSTGCKLSISRIIQASPVMLQQYLAHKNSILRQLRQVLAAEVAADFDAEMIQDAMAVLSFPSRRSSGDKVQRRQLIRAHLRAWSNSQLPDPLKGNDDELVSQLHKLRDRILLLVEDYITKATASFPPQEYLCLPQIQPSSTKGHLMFKGLKVTRRFSSANLTASERKRFVKAFLVYDLLCKTSNVTHIPSNRRLRKVSDAECEAIGCVHSYVCSLYGAMLAQCNSASIPACLVEPSHTAQLFNPVPDAVFFDANIYAPNLQLYSYIFGDDIGAGLSVLGLNCLTNFLRYDMANPDERKALDKKLKDAWNRISTPFVSPWDNCFMLFDTSKRKYKNVWESSLYYQISLKPKEELRYKLCQERAWVFFDDRRFYPDESTERPTFPSEKFLAEQPTKKTFINDWFDDLRDGKDQRRG
ncbi:hypothetical protein FGADI_4097 [Fusarium gaditjirri]|uniref:Uncharacterized protein n=1 Tax=Fusarium gaditjirri TaxID=282569 RepID=A0A8H4WZD4_9HYPO|nr:hypothetical protein FGADI_4097 [Fusarium gaditjirri]